MQKKRKIFNKRVQDFTIYSIHGRRVSADECVRATPVWVLILTDFGRCNLSETKKKKMLHIVWAAELLALFTIITRTGYLLVAQIRPHLTLFLSPVMCHFALISSLVLLSAQFYGLFPHFHSLYLSLSFCGFFFLFFSLSPPLSAGWPLHLAPHVPSYQKPALAVSQTRLHRAQCVRPASNIMNYNGSIGGGGGAPAAFVLRRIQV